MDIVEYAEKVANIRLLECQKVMLRKFAELPKDTQLAMTPRGPRLITQYLNEPVPPDKIDICPKCNGTGLNIRGLVCWKCQGTGHYRRGKGD